MFDRLALPLCAVLVAAAWAYELRARRRLAAALDAEHALVVELRNVVALAPYAHRRTQLRSYPRHTARMMPMQRGKEWHA